MAEPIDNTRRRFLKSAPAASLALGAFALAQAPALTSAVLFLAHKAQAAFADMADAALADDEAGAMRHFADVVKAAEAMALLPVNDREGLAAKRRVADLALGSAYRTIRLDQNLRAALTIGEAA